MANEAIYVSPELKKRLIKEAGAAGLTLDELLATRGFAQEGAPNGNGTSHLASSPTPRTDSMRDRLEAMQDMWMMRSLAQGGVPVPGAQQAPDPVQLKTLEVLDKIAERLEKPAQNGGSDDLGIDSIVRQAIRYRAMSPILKSIGGDEEGAGGNKLFREVEKELRERVDKAQDQMLAELRAKDREISDIKEKQSEARLADYRDTVKSLESRIEGLAEQLTAGPPAAQTSVAQQLTEALTQAQTVQNALTQIANANRPAAPAPGEQRDTVQTIAYLANELSGAVSKGLEAVARVNAAQHGRNPDAMGRMPPAGQGPPVYQPQYVEAPQPARRTPPPRVSRPAHGPESTTMGPGSRITFERPIKPMGQAESAPELRAPGPGPEVASPAADSELPPLDPRIQQYFDPQGKPISPEEYQAIRLKIWQEHGIDAAQVVQTQDAPQPEAPAEAPPTEETDAGPEPADGEGTGDSGSA